MGIEEINNSIAILMNLVGLMLCLFMYFKRTNNPITFATVFFLGCFLSNYYWGVYVLVMHDDPSVSSLLAYAGWNVAFVMIVLLQLSLRKEIGQRSFSPLALLPVPLNILQLIKYLEFGGIFNNIWQVFWANAVACLALDGILYYRKTRAKGSRFPYINIVLLLYVTLEFATWTVTCFDWPSDLLDPYYYLCFISYITYILIPVAISKEYAIGKGKGNTNSRSRLAKIFKPIYIVFVLFCCLGGYFIAVWMRNTLTAAIADAEETDAFTTIAVMLFIVSFIIVAFTVTIILIVSSEQKAHEREELAKAKQLAENSNAAKSEFLANMSHEIRTPINAVLGMNEMILQESLRARDTLPQSKNETQAVFTDICTYAGNIDSAGKNLLSIINDILDFSKIEAGKLEIVETDYSLSNVLNDLSNMISFKAASKGLQFEVHADSSLPNALHGDEVRVRQIVTNLLNNAVKYTPKGSVELNVSERSLAGNENEKRTELVFSVKDTGIGIKDVDKGRLFKKFERMDIEKNSSIEGTGLGLAITGSLVEMMGGTISVDSDYGHGSTFTATIPQYVLSDERLGDFRERFQKSISALEVKQEPFHAPDAHILVVDDTQMNLTVVKGLLKKTMIDIDTASSGTEALAMANSKVYDVILMDQRMPEMDGTTAMRLIIEDRYGSNKETPFICLTADAVSGAKERYLSEGFSDYLTKPLDSQALEEMLLKFIPKDKIMPADAEIPPIKRPAPEEKAADPVPEEKAADPDPSGLIDRKAALQFCNGDEDFYDVLLAEYQKESVKKKEALTKSFQEKDWNTYGVHVHSLKSTSKTIGATELSEIARRLENAAKDENAVLIEAEHDRMMRMYEDVLALVHEAEPDMTPEDEDEDFELFEFTPE